MKVFYPLLTFLLVCLFSSTSFAQSLPLKPELPFKIYDTRTGEQLTMTELADRMGKTEVMFWGEEHNDTIGHILELKMLKLLNERYRNKLVLSLEMFETDCQVLVDEYLGGFINKEKFLKDARAWNNYEDYSPMVEYAKENRISVVAANSPRRINNLMSKRGPKSLDSLGSGSKALIAKLPIYAPKSGAYYKKFVGIMGGEGNIHSPNMFASQCLWDATMAQSIDRAISNNKKGGIVMHVCGRFHSDEYLGTVAQLLRKDKGVRATTISCFTAEDFDKPDYEAYEPLADFVILTKKMGAE
jgi:uncharacterized iron-regulated protein